MQINPGIQFQQASLPSRAPAQVPVGVAMPQNNIPMQNQQLGVTQMQQLQQDSQYQGQVHPVSTQVFDSLHPTADCLAPWQCITEQIRFFISCSQLFSSLWTISSFVLCPLKIFFMGSVQVWSIFSWHVASSQSWLFLVPSSSSLTTFSHPSILCLFAWSHQVLPLHAFIFPTCFYSVHLPFLLESNYCEYSVLFLPLLLLCDMTSLNLSIFCFSSQHGRCNNTHI